MTRVQPCCLDQFATQLDLYGEVHLDGHGHVIDRDDVEIGKVINERLAPLLAAFESDAFGDLAEWKPTGIQPTLTPTEEQRVTSELVPLVRQAAASAPL